MPLRIPNIRTNLKERAKEATKSMEGVLPLPHLFLSSSSNTKCRPWKAKKGRCKSLFKKRIGKPLWFNKDSSAL